MSDQASNPALDAARKQFEALKKKPYADIVIVEGYKREPIPKLEIFRTATGKPPLFPNDPLIFAVATDDASALPATPPQTLDLNDIEAITAHICALAGRGDVAAAS